jgi:hypothetical protein
MHLGLGADVPEQLAARLAEVTDRAGEQVPQSGAAQGTNEVARRWRQGCWAARLAGQPSAACAC